MLKQIVKYRDANSLLVKDVSDYEWYNDIF